MKDNLTQRREFLKRLGLVVGAVAVSPFFKIREAFSALIEEKKGLALSLAYVHDATKSDEWKKLKKKNDDVCANCTFYSPVDKVNGKCTIFPTGEVAAKGWCRTFNRKVDAKKA